MLIVESRQKQFLDTQTVNKVVIHKRKAIEFLSLYFPRIRCLRLSFQWLYKVRLYGAPNVYQT